MRNQGRQKVSELRREKLRREIESAKRLLQSGMEPLKVADGFFHELFNIRLEGIQKRYPDLTEEERLQKIEATLAFSQKLKSKRLRRRNL